MTGSPKRIRPNCLKVFAAIVSHCGTVSAEHIVEAVRTGTTEAVTIWLAIARLMPVTLPAWGWL